MKTPYPDVVGTVDRVVKVIKQEEATFFGTIDDFAISGFQDGSFDSIIDIMFLDPSSLSGILGDVDQDGLVGQSDYDTWSSNVGFNNGLGVGDPGTLFRGDVDQNGIVMSVQIFEGCVSLFALY